MAANAWQVYDVFLEFLHKEGHQFSTDNIQLALMYSSYTPATSTDNTFDVIDANEHATTHGYTAGGLSLPCTVATTAGVLTLDSGTNPVWTASGGTISVRYAVIYNGATTTNNLIAYSLLDSTPADVSATDGNTLTVTISSAGIYTMT
jgi:hypothetical protein